MQKIEDKTLLVGKGVSCFSLDSTGELIATGYSDGIIRIWELETQRIWKTFYVKPLKRNYCGWEKINFSPDGDYLVASPARSNTINIGTVVWDIQIGEIISHVQGGYRANAIAPDGKRYVDIGGESVVVRDLLSNEVIKEITGHWDYVWDVTVSPDGRTVGSCGRYNVMGS